MERPEIEAHRFPIPDEVGDHEWVAVRWDNDNHGFYLAHVVRNGWGGAVGWALPPRIIPPRPEGT